MNTVSQVSFQANTNPKKQKVKNNKLGAAAAVGASLLTKQGLMCSTFGRPYVNVLIKQSKLISSDEKEIANKGIDAVLNNLSGLADKGVKIKDLQAIPSAESTVDVLVTNRMASIASGRNAGYLNEVPFENINITKVDNPKTLKDIINNAKIDYKNAFSKNGIESKSILINRDKLPIAAFHEMGHAFNANSSKLWRAVQKMRGPAKLASTLFMLLPAFTKKEKAEEGKELTKAQKAKNAVRDFAPLLAGLSFAPIIAEELKATLRGNKWAKQVLDSNMAKKVAKSNAIALCSYIGAAAFTAVGAFVAKKIKDKSDDKLAFKSQSFAESKVCDVRIQAHQG